MNNKCHELRLWEKIEDVNLYSRTPRKAYPSVDGPRYALWEVMGYERSILV